MVFVSQTLPDSLLLSIVITFLIIAFILKYKSLEEKDKIIASLRQQLKEALSRCSALEQENALLSYELEKKNKKSDRTVSNIQ